MLGSPKLRSILIATVVVAAACTQSETPSTAETATPTTEATAISDSPPTTDEAEYEPTIAADDRFGVHVVSPNSDGPAGAEAADIDGDGDLDLVVNFFGDRGVDPGPTEFPPGGITIFWNEGDLDSWTAEPVLTRDDNVYFPNEAIPHDMDGDGDLDLLVSAGFFVCEFNLDLGPCGALFWLEQDVGTWSRHDIVAEGSEGFYHRVEFADVTGDGIDDLLTVAEFQADAEAQWFEGLGPDAAEPFDPTIHVIGQGGGSLPVAHDIDGDGDIDLASGEFFLEGASFAWFEQVAPPGDTAPDGTWERHIISTELGRTIQLSLIEGLLGEGADGWIGSNHVNTVTGDPEPLAGIYLLEPSADPAAEWTATLLSEGIESRPTVGVAFQAAPGVFSWGDVDNDGDIDITVSGDGDDRVFLLEQTAEGVFEQHVMAEGFGQAASGLVEDLDGDGRSEVVFTSYETNEVLIFSIEN